MATRDEIEAQIAEIDAKLTAGAERVSHADSSVGYNLGELRRRRTELRAALSSIDGGTRIRQIRTYSTKGL